MANPNIVNVSDIRGKTVGANLSTTAANVVTNSSGSNKVFKVNSFVVSNIDGTNAADVTAGVYKGGSVLYHLAYTISVPADSTLVVVSKDTGIYLEENDSIRATASANSDLQAVISYEEIS
jgi:hypothetical protein